jgi:aspartyl-tRNA(Asn)/glutamyl-tRNA(Gln) amidotransferase subunit A
MTPSILDSIEKGTRWSAVDWLRAHDRRTQLFRAVQLVFERFDVIATPTMTAPPKPLDAGGSIATPMYAEWAAPLYPFNLTGHPALSVPAGFTAGGLPVGLQLIGSWFAERQLLRLAALLEAMNPWHEQRPPLH